MSREVEEFDRVSKEYSAMLARVEVCRHTVTTREEWLEQAREELLKSSEELARLRVELLRQLGPSPVAASRQGTVSADEPERPIRIRDLSET